MYSIFRFLSDQIAQRGPDHSVHRQDIARASRRHLRVFLAASPFGRLHVID
jgi:hypothetical protein